MRNHNYFKIFDIPVNFDLDFELLETKYINLQKKLHPDNFRSANAIKQAIINTSVVNDAYNTLKHTLSRAEHILYLNDIMIQNEKPDINLLNKVMETNEIISQTEDEDELKKIRNDIEALIQECIKNITNAVKTSNKKCMIKYTIELKYLTKLKRSSIMMLSMSKE